MTTFRTIENVNGVVYQPAETTVIFAEDINAITTAINQIELVSDHFSYNDEDDFVACDVKFGSDEQIFSADGSLDFESLTAVPGYAFASNLLTGFFRSIVFSTEFISACINGIPVWVTNAFGDFFIFRDLEVFGSLRSSGNIIFSVERVAPSDDYDPYGSDAVLNFFNTLADINLKSISGGKDGMIKIFRNTGSYNITVVNEWSGASIGTKIKTSDGLDLVVPPGGTFTVFYDTPDFNWIIN